MDKEGIIDEAAIDELLAVANKELFALEPETAAPADNETSQLSATEEKQPPQTFITQKIFIFTQLLRQMQLRGKVCIAVVLLLCLCIGAGGYLGYQNKKQLQEAPLSFDEIIQQGITFEGRTFVTYAGRGNKNVVSAFLDAGMEVNTSRNTDGWTALTAASFYKKTELVKLLLEKQANVNLQDRYGRTPLMYAAAMDNEEIVTLLLHAGADPNIQDHYGRTALMEAYSKNAAKIAETLKNSGADPNPPAAPPSPVKETPSPSTPAVPEEIRLSPGRAGLIKIGMALEDIKKISPALSLSEEYSNGSKQTFAIIPSPNTSTPSLKLELSAGKSKLVSTVSVYDENFSTEKNITIHSTVGEIRSQYSINEIRVIDSSLYLQVKSMKMLFELDINDSAVLLNWIKNDTPDAIPSNTKIKRIILY